MKIDTDDQSHQDDEVSAPTVILPSPPANLRRRRRSVRFGLGTRFSLAAATLVLATMLAAVAIVTARANVVAHRTIRDDLGRVPANFETYESDLQARIRAQVRSLAGEPGTKALFDPGVPLHTRWDSAKEMASILNANTVFLFGRDSTVLARTDRPEGDGAGRHFGAVKWVSEPLETWRESSAAIREGDRLCYVAAAPIITGEGDMASLDGLVAASFPLDAANADALRGITRGQVAFLVDEAGRGEPPRLAVSRATKEFPADPFPAAFAALPGAISTLFDKRDPVGPFELTLGGLKRIGVAVPIRSAAGVTYGAVVVLRTLKEEMAAFREIANTISVVGVLALLIATPLALALGRRIASPLRQLAAGAEAIREGRLDVPLPVGGRDEVGSLAKAFRAMVGELKEKRSLEELVGQLSRSAAPAATMPATGDPTQGMRPGDTLGNRYRLERVLGRGAMAVVFLAKDRELEDEVALKLLTPKAFDEGTQALQTIRQEIRLARRITHPNVVRVHDLGEATGVRFLTMEFVPGITLRQLIDQQGPLALGPGLQIAKQLCRGLAAVHESGIVHRDIKPQNIMVLPGGTVKLMDFGIAQSVAADHSNDEVAGTPYYMSPEQTRGGAMDGRSDLYSVGATLYELFTGCRPFEGSISEVIRKHVSEEAVPPTTVRPDLPDMLERLILSCLAKEPARRPASAQDLYAALMRVAVPDATAV
jgi:eukaryotic-like serine/threonine-protein kinase